MTNKDDKPKRASARPSKDDSTHRNDLFRPQRPEDADPPDPLDLLAGGDVDNDMKTYSADDVAPSLELETDEADEAPEISSTETDWDRKDRAFTLVEFGRPRTVQLSTGPLSLMRLTDASTLALAGELAFDKASDAVAKRRLLESLDQPLTLEGPASLDAIDTAISTVFEAFPHFGPVLQAIRESAQLNLSRGASWLSFRPMLIVSPPGLGKTSVASKLASTCALPMALLDGSTMTTATPLLGGDAIYRSARASDIVQNLAANGIGNPVVVFDEIDKATDTSRGGRESPAEAMLGFLEQRSAQCMHDHFLGIDLDLSHLNWILLANDLSKIPAPVRDRCKVIQIESLTTNEIVAIATREVERRKLSSDLLREISKACRRGEIKSLRKLSKALDAAEAVLTRPRLH
ncbi:AAA family ATPase [Devosia sp.]|uniref:AAA family ATPase n=1 Tax=Devosia sp. TaxID=1871048 RepID=UPI0025FF741B|nr:AAA family ATPase [Devosia sp.]MCR6634908.1 AAA family ATPase [Devosia sp.]